MKKSVLTAVTIAAVAAFALTGCSGAQSVDAACKAVSQDLESLGTKTSSAVADIQSDPAAAATVFSDIETGLNAAAKKISNEEVKPNVEGLAKSMGEFSQIFTDASGDFTSIDDSKLTTISAEMQEFTAGLQEQCKL